MSDYHSERAAAFADPGCDDTASAPARRPRRTRKPADPNAPTRESLLAALETRDAVAERAVSVLYARQTADEQATATTREHNGRGFNATDAELLTSFAQQLERGRHLSPRQLEWARRKVRKYVGQLLEVALARYAERKGAA